MKCLKYLCKAGPVGHDSCSFSIHSFMRQPPGQTMRRLCTYTCVQWVANCSLYFMQTVFEPVLRSVCEWRTCSILNVCGIHSCPASSSALVVGDIIGCLARVRSPPKQHRGVESLNRSKNTEGRCVEHRLARPSRACDSGIPEVKDIRRIDLMSYQLYLAVFQSTSNECIVDFHMIWWNQYHTKKKSSIRVQCEKISKSRALQQQQPACQHFT